MGFGHRRQLFCVCDRLGAKPFHDYHRGNLFLFGSELKQLCQADEAPRRFDRTHLSGALIYSIADYGKICATEPL